jgi:hypothetical protein
MNGGSKLGIASSTTGSSQDVKGSTIQHYRTIRVGGREISAVGAERLFIGHQSTLSDIHCCKMIKQSVFFSSCILKCSLIQSVQFMKCNDRGQLLYLGALQQTTENANANNLRAERAGV